MIYSNNNYELFSKIKNCGICATIGNFDGVHLGHQSLINKIVDISNNESYMSLVISFWPHPLSILRPNNAPFLIKSHDEKILLLKRQNIDAFLELKFTNKMAETDPENFFNKYIFPLNLKCLVIGYDFCLGKNRVGDVNMLKSIGEKYGFSVIQMPAVKKNGTIISSTLIRKAIIKGYSYASWC